MGIFLFPAPGQQRNQTAASGPHPCPQDNRPFGRYAEDLFYAGQGLGIGESTLIHLFLAGLDDPVDWEELGELDTWSYWEMVDHVIYLKEVELLEGAPLPVWAVVPEPPRIGLATCRFSVSFFRRLGLRRSVEDAQLMSVKQAVAAHGSPKAALSVHKAREAAASAHRASQSQFREPTESAPEPAPFREPTESAPEPAPFREPTESAPEPAPFREPTESAPEPAPFREPTESAPEPAPFREPTESAPEPAPFREPTESVPEPAPPREPTESVPEPAPFREPTQSAPFREPTESAPVREPTHSAPVREPTPVWEPTEAAPGTAPPWHPCVPIPPDPLPLHGPGPPSWCTFVPPPS